MPIQAFIVGSGGLIDCTLAQVLRHIYREPADTWPAAGILPRALDRLGQAASVFFVSPSVGVGVPPSFLSNPEWRLWNDAEWFWTPRRGSTAVKAWHEWFRLMLPGVTTIGSRVSIFEQPRPNGECDRLLFDLMHGLKYLRPVSCAEAATDVVARIESRLFLPLTLVADTDASGFSALWRQRGYVRDAFLTLEHKLLGRSPAEREKAVAPDRLTSTDCGSAWYRLCEAYQLFFGTRESHCLRGLEEGVAPLVVDWEAFDRERSGSS